MLELWLFDPIRLFGYNVLWYRRNNRYGQDPGRDAIAPKRLPRQHDTPEELDE